ncbi:zinc finger protein Aiolos isoform X1 [Pseudophryne corroboree]|uniref:zinc finger protein Aiolos isoform X1 n=1 Tax=Pseudophryne corroboree TaxID=495146 RepID=UPI00308186D1
MTDVDIMDSVNCQEQPQPADLSVSSSKRVSETDLHVGVYQHCKAEDGSQSEGMKQVDIQGEDSSEDMVNVKNESTESAAAKHPEGIDVSYEYGSECVAYNNIHLERQTSYDLTRPSLGKLYCDICGLSCNSLNVLLVHKRSHTGERPFQCNQCGASFTQKGNLLRHGKLHTGEKPFKCHLCSYACQRRDALSGHLRTHSVEKPFKCEFCGRSYKQRSSLEEHKERCRVYLQNISESAVNEPKQMKPEMGSERALVLDRLASNVAKRKSSMPQKFIGEKRQCFEVPYNNFLYDKDHDAMNTRMMEQSIGNPMAYLSPGVLRPIIHTPPTATAEMVSVISSLYPVSLTRIDISNGHLPTQPDKEKKPAPESCLSPGANALDSTDTDSSHEERPSYPSNLNGAPMRTNSVLQPPREHPRVCDVLRYPGLSQRDLLQLLSKDGCPLGVYRCDHCYVLFLDYVMFTIHMGCHGFRDPFECNMCGHRSQDRYEFSSHIARGEHRLGMN